MTLEIIAVSASAEQSADCTVELTTFNTIHSFILCKRSTDLNYINFVLLINHVPPFKSCNF